MKKTYDSSIYLCSNRTDRKIPVHGLSGMYFTDDRGFMVFELDQTQRDLNNRHVSISEGCFLLTDKGCYKITSLVCAEKRPKRITCTTVLTDKKEIPHYHKFNFEEGTYSERKKPRKGIEIPA